MLIETLELRLAVEALDRRAASPDVRDALAGWFEGRPSLRVLDVTGAASAGGNLRSLAPLMSPDQLWTLPYSTDRHKDETLDHLTRWAPAATPSQSGIRLERQGLGVTTVFLDWDPVARSAIPEDDGTDLVVLDEGALAFAPDLIRRIVATASRLGAVVHARGLYNGRLKLHPHHAADNAMISALHRQLMFPTPLGNSAGPLAASELAEQLSLSGYTVIEGDSDLLLKSPDAQLMSALIRRIAEAQRLVAKGHDKMIDTWVQRQRTALQVSRTDLVAFPPRPSDR